jgi:signal transduction histidine kinase
MLVEEILANKGRKVFALRPNHTARDAAALIAQRNIGAAPVVSPDGALLGIISERDLVRGLDQLDSGLLDLPVSTLMTRAVITCTPQMTVADALALMGVHHIRHLPVMLGTEVLGLISIRDVLESELEHQQGHFAALLHAKRQASLALQAAELAHHAKTEFLANISYELKNPLNTIVGFAEYLSNEGSNPAEIADQARYLRRIEDDSRHLLEIVDNLLDLSRLQIKALELAKEPLSLSGVIKSCVAEVGKRAERKGVAVETETDTSLPMVTADGKLVRRMLSNLLTNSIQLTHQGGAVTVRSMLGRGGDVCVHVADNGAGIAPDHLAKIMSSPHHLTTHSGHDSTSLRLALVHALAQAHGGALDIESRVGIGTSATLRFPTERGSAELAAA